MDFLSVIPALITLILGIWTRRIVLSLSCGIFFAALIARDMHVGASFALTFDTLLRTLDFNHFVTGESFFDGWNSLICIALLQFGIIVELLHRSGSAHAYAAMVKSRVQSKRGAEISSLLMSKVLCIDDYFSSLTVGSVMRPVTDSFRVPRAKLAFLVDAMAAPLAIICPVSSWVAAIIGFLREAGIDQGPNAAVIGSPFVAYFNMLPYLFYSFAITLSAWLIVGGRLSFGKMAGHEREEENAPAEDLVSPSNATLADFTVPLIFLIVSLVGAILGSGGFFNKGTSFGDALRAASAASGLFFGTSIALLAITIWLIGRGRIDTRDLIGVGSRGIRMMLPACTILICAWSFGDLMRNELGTGNYLAGLLSGRIDPEFAPAMFFIVAMITSFSMGSSWGTAAVLVPIAVQYTVHNYGITDHVIMAELPSLFPILGATLSGGVAGDHLSPISDTTIMASTSTQISHIEHVETQLGYAFPAVFWTWMAFFFLGFGLSYGQTVSVAAAGLATQLMFHSNFYRKRRLARQ